MTNGERSFLGYLPDGHQLSYSYRQSIYDVIVSEEFVRSADRLDMQSISAKDIRAIEYFRWDTPITQQHDTYFSKAPPTTVPELVIRITPLGQQRVRSGDWSIGLLPHFGESVVHVRPERLPLIVALVRGLSW